MNGTDAEREGVGEGGEDGALLCPMGGRHVPRTDGQHFNRFCAKCYATLTDRAARSTPEEGDDG